MDVEALEADLARLPKMVDRARALIAGGHFEGALGRSKLRQRLEKRMP